MLITVTQDHIDAGEPMKLQTCPVAIAINEQTGLSCQVHESVFAIDDKGDGPFRWLPLPPDVAEWVSMYDMEIDEPWPFEFELELE